MRIPGGVIRLSMTFLVLASISAACANPQDTAVQTPASPAPTRPRIGLALSGGGALGLVEIGVIKWMEEKQIPVDRIAGTSMGAIIGSMYASGMSPQEIEAFARKINWDQAFLPEPPYDEISYRRKQDRRDFTVAAPLGLKKGLRGPNGLNSGQAAG
ncbi:MAG TPA: patatin-like phospholipase family protein, partial [Candidatus Eisenbacteria bacterium]|nr:patatin-like phospholipase family protein [Candidatus Eisenbacteria bacterium]